MMMSPPPAFGILSVVPVSFMNLYHSVSLLLMLLSNTQVNVVDLPSHTVTSSGSLITIAGR